MDAREHLSQPASLPNEVFERLARYISGEVGIKMPKAKLTMVQSLLLRRGYFFAGQSGSRVGVEVCLKAVKTSVYGRVL